MADLSKVMISFLDDSKNVLLSKKLSSIPLKEEIVIKKSIEFFSDPSPCMIHRSAVMLRLYMEILEYLDKYMEKNAEFVDWEEIPEHLRNYLSVGFSNIKYVVLRHK